jgi:hypothetical protein
MTAPLTGIQGFVIGDPEATAEQRMGGTADPRHNILGEQATPYPWEAYPGEAHGPYGAENQLLGVEADLFYMDAAQVVDDPTMDQTPLTHAAPWPKGVIQSRDPVEQSARRAESAAIHAVNMGASREMLYEPTIDPTQDRWEAIQETNPGYSGQVPIPSQVMTGGVSGFGSYDRTQSMQRQNGYDFGSKHMHRRYAAGSIPGNFLWMEPGSRPLVKSIPGTSRPPVGLGPFQGQDPGVSYDSQGAALNVLPVSYSAPAQPALAADYAGSSEPGDVAWW